MSLSFVILVLSSFVYIPILGSFSESPSTKLIVPLFFNSEEFFANIPTDFCPLIFIVPLFSKVALSPDIPVEEFPANVIIPVVSFVPTAAALVALALLFLI